MDIGSCCCCSFGTFSHCIPYTISVKSVLTGCMYTFPQQMDILRYLHEVAPKILTKKDQHGRVPADYAAQQAPCERDISFPAMCMWLSMLMLTLQCHESSAHLMPVPRRPLTVFQLSIALRCFSSLEQIYLQMQHRVTICLLVWPL